MAQYRPGFPGRGERSRRNGRVDQGAWENPYVNVLKHFKVGEWKRASKSGDVSYVMDKTVQSYVYKILGSTPAANYIQIPGKCTRPLGLTGRYCYVLFKLMPTKAFVIHLDLVTKGDLVIRVSFSNIFKEFKFTSTWLQFPFVDEGEKGSVFEHTSQRDIGPTTGSSRWTCLVLDLLAILSVYLTQQYSSLKAMKLCSCLLLKNVFTSDVIYLPGVSFLEAKRRGLIAQGLNAMPRDMAFPVPKGKIWEDMYDYIRCPNNASQLAFDSMQNNVQGLNPMPRDMGFPVPKGRSLEHGGSLIKEPHMSANESHQKLPKAMKPCMNPKMELLVTRTLPRVHFVAMPNTRAHKHRDETFHHQERYCGQDGADESCTHDHRLTATPSPKQRQRRSTQSPRMMMKPAGQSKAPAGTIKVLLGGSESSGNAADNRASRSSAKLVKYEDSLVVEENRSYHRGVSTRPLNHATAGVPSARHAMVRAPPGPTSYRHFLPYLNNSGSFKEQSYHEKGKQPIHLKSILGYNGNARANIVWYTSSGLLAYSCGRILILEELQSGKQRYLATHMEEISTLAQSHDYLVLASASGTRDWTVGQMCLWDVHRGTLKETLQHLHREVQAMAFSADDRFLLSAGDYRDGWLALWSMITFERLARVQAPCPINDVASDLTDSSIFLCAGTQALLICHLDFHLGQTSLQVSKASMPNEMDATELSSVAFSPHGVIYTGTILGKVCAWNTHQRCCFLSWDADCGDIGVLLCRRCKILSGSERKKLKLWNVRALLNFIDKGTPSDTKVLLEQEMLLDGAVTAAVFDDDLDMGVVGTMAGTVWYIGWMDGSSTRLLSGHPGKVIALAVSLDGDALASATSDGNLRVWDLQEMELSVQFHVQKQDCRCVAWSPQHGGEGRWLACGYTDGTFRLFALPASRVLLKLKPHVCTINQLVFSCNGEILLSGDMTGRIAVSSTLARTTLRVIDEHAGSELRSLQCIACKWRGERWLATSADGLVTIWSANWERESFLLEHSLTLPAQFKAGGGKDVLGTGDIPGVALLCGSDSDSLLWAGGAENPVLFSYHLSGKQTSQVTSLSSALTCMAVSTDRHFVAIGTQGRTLRLVDMNTGHCRDAESHSGGVTVASFSRNGKLLATAAGNEILVWRP